MKHYITDKIMQTVSASEALRLRTMSE